MKEDTIMLLRKLYSGVISNDTFIQKYFKGKQIPEDFLQNLLKESILKKESDLVEEVLVLIHVTNSAIIDFTSDLCHLLQLDWHYKHEDIVILLSKTRNPLVVESLYKTVELKLDYLSYDDTFQLARKCIKALSEIEIAGAISKLELLSKSDNSIIAAYAIKELNRSA